MLEHHKVFMSSGHDEYWSGQQRDERRGRPRRRGQPRVLQRQRGVLEDALGAEHRRHRTRPTGRWSTYKDTHFDDAHVDPRTRPPGRAPGSIRGSARRRTAGRPQNALTGQLFVVNSGTTDITVPVPVQQAAVLAQHRRWPAWRPASRSRSMPGVGTLGYEWDVDADNGFRPAGLFDMSSTTVPARRCSPTTAAPRSRTAPRPTT